MRHLEEHRIHTESRAGPPAGVWSLAAFSVAVFLCSVLGAKILSNMFSQSDAPAASLSEAGADAAMRRLARAAPSAQAPQTVTIVRSVGVDGVTTATIPRQPASAPAAALSPCGDGTK